MINLDVLERLATDANQVRLMMQEKLLNAPLTRAEADEAYTQADRFAAAIKPRIVLDLVAELRAAREVVEAVHKHATHFECWVTDAIAAYEKVTGSK